MSGGRRKGKGKRGKGQGERDEREEKGFCSGRDEGYDKDKGKTKDSNHLDEAWLCYTCIQIRTSVHPYIHTSVHAYIST